MLLLPLVHKKNLQEREMTHRHSSASVYKEFVDRLSVDDYKAVASSGEAHIKSLSEKHLERNVPETDFYSPFNINIPFYIFIEYIE